MQEFYCHQSFDRANRLLKQSLNKAYEQYKLKNNKGDFSFAREFIFIKSGYEQIRIQLDEILYVESNGNYMQFVLTGHKITSRLTLSEVEELLPAGGFIRIHQSYIVRKNQITKIEKNTVWINQIQLPVGVAYVTEIEKILKMEI